jgi:tricorn protease
LAYDGRAKKARRNRMSKTAHGNVLKMVAMAMLAATLVALAGAKLAQTWFPDEALPYGNAPIAFKDDGDIWVAGKRHLVNLTSNTTTFKDVDPAVSPDGRQVAFASDRDGDFEIYMANVSTGKVERVTDNEVDDHKPAWSPYGRWISYQSPTYSSPTHSGIFSAKVVGAAAS